MKIGEIIEWVLIILATASLWPWLFGYRATWYWLVLIAAFIAMVWVAVRRIARVRGTR
jgi:hypothetical protein